jgi:NAD+ dependent glucose-6-phosphate dehydrogenase
MTDVQSKRVLLTGAAGNIGSALRRYLAARPELAAKVQLRLAAHHVEKLGDQSDHEVVQLELADLESCRAACRGMDAVIHLAANIRPSATFDELHAPNIVGAYNMLRAAIDAGCGRMVFASSVQAVDGYPHDVQVHTDSAVWPASLYGATKAFAEAMCRHYASAEGLSCIAVRIGTFDLPWLYDAITPHRLSKYVSHDDMSQLLLRCVDAQDIGFAIVHGISNNRFKRLDLTSTREAVGYEPEDDGFARFDVAFPSKASMPPEIKVLEK